MTGIQWPAVFFCLAAGAALGVLFLLCKVLRLALGAGRLLTALLDVLFGLVCGAVVFLCALAVDKGRMRLLQAVLQAAGAWSAIVALDPFAARLGRGLRLLRRKLAALVGRPLGWARRKLARHKPRKRRARGVKAGRRGKVPRPGASPRGRAAKRPPR